jgi:hypothetical protein
VISLLNKFDNKNIVEFLIIKDMDTKWIEPKTTIGDVAKGNYYYHRKDIVDAIWRELEKGNSILIAAPRRSGKTSIMRHIEDNPKNYKVIFENIQGIDSGKRFYATLYRLLLSCLSKNQKIKQWFQKIISSKSISELDIKGKVKIENSPLDFIDEIDRLLIEINEKEEIENIVLLIDELPDVLFNINKKDKDEAKSILKNLRRWRQNKASGKVKFVFAGSVGIHYVVNAIENRNSDINDLVTINCNPLDKNEFPDYIHWATENATVKYNPDLQQYLSEKILYFLPYFINLMLSKIDEQARKKDNPEISEQMIDEAFNTIVKENDYFTDWKNRLKDYMPPADFDFVNEILIHIAHKDAISIQAIYDKAVKYKKTADYMDFINDLEKDGYIVEYNQKYIFISPFLKDFWKRNNLVYHG